MILVQLSKSLKGAKRMIDISGYKEIDRIELSKELVFTLYGIGILCLFAFGYLFLAIYPEFPLN